MIYSAIDINHFNNSKSFQLLKNPSQRHLCSCLQMAAHSVVRSLTDEYLTCRICLQAFNRPRRISCQHSFCTDCIRQLVTKSPANRGPDKLLCPLCRLEVLIPADVSLDDFVCNLPIDSLIVDLQTTLSRHNRNPEISRTANVNSNDSCKAHPGRQLGHYCFHHAQLICAKCIDDFHHEPHCRCRSLIEARRELQPRVDRVLQRLHSEVRICVFVYFYVHLPLFKSKCFSPIERRYFSIYYF